MNQKLCDHCGKEAAVINYHENKNGTVRDLHLCAACAAKLGIGIFQEDLFSHLSSFSLFSPTSQSAKKSPAERQGILLSTLLSQEEVSQNHDAQHDAVPAEHLEIVLFDEGRQELDGEQGHDERHERTDEKIPNLRAEEPSPVEEEFEEFQRACAEHDGNGKKEGKLCAYRSGNSQKQGT